jgi:hypothetical protein
VVSQDLGELAEETGGAAMQREGVNRGVLIQAQLLTDVEEVALFEVGEQVVVVDEEGLKIHS